MGLDLAFGRAAEERALLEAQALVQAESGDWREARSRFERAARVDRSAVLAAHNTAVACLRTGDLPCAREWNRETLRRAPSFAPARALRRRIEPRSDAAR